MSEIPKFKLKIEPTVLDYIKPEAPKENRLMMAKGAVPMPSSILATVLTFLLEDVDEEVRTQAKTGLLEMPKGVIQAILREPAHPKTLDFFAKEQFAQEDLMEPILLNPYTLDETCVFLAAKVSERLATIIISNQVRLLRTPTIAEILKQNPKALRSQLDAMVSFLRINGILLEGESPELTNEEIKLILDEPESTGAQVIPKDLVEEELEDIPLTEEKKKTFQQIIRDLNVAQKIKLALRGNKEARSLLIKDSNKIVAASVIKSPKITDSEVISICNMRTVHDEVIRIITTRPEWVKHYVIQVALANNPKTPFPIAVRFARQLNITDLQKLSKNKNVSGQISRMARQIFEDRRK